MAGWVRSGLPAGVSTVLAFLAGALTDLFTEDWSWPVGAGLGVLLLCWVGWEMRQAAAGPPVAGRSDVDGDAVPDPPAGPAPLVPHQLPATVAHFTGRAAELSALTGLLNTGTGPAAQMVIAVISGTAGVGKSTLAGFWADQVRDRFPDGQLYVNLRGFDPGGSVMDPAEAVRGFLDALHVPPQRVPAGLAGQAALYRGVMAGRRMLIVLDNARDSGQVRPLLPAAAGCLVLVTSRHQLSSLVANDGAQPVTLGLLAPVEAEQLLARRLGAARTGAEPEAVKEIVTACARLPLALAMVAGRATTYPHFPLARLAAELADRPHRLDALAGEDSRTGVRAVFSWSYRTLSPPAAGLFRLLGLHPGPDLAAPAAASLAGVPLPDVRPLLAELTRASLIVEHLPGRYTFHDLLRAYAIDLVARHESGQRRRAATQRVLDHYLHTGYAAARLLYPSRQPITLDPPGPGVTPEAIAGHEPALDWFTAEHTVLLGAVEHAAGAGCDRHAWQLAWTLNDFLDWRGHWLDQITIQRTAVAAAGRLDEPAAQAHAHCLLAYPYIRLGRLDDAETELRTALDRYRRAGEPSGQVSYLLALVVGRRGRPAEALDHARSALRLYQASGDRIWAARSRNLIGWYHAQLGDHWRAVIHCRQALTLLAEAGDRHGQAVAWDSLGHAQHRAGRHAEAISCYRSALDLFRELGDRYEEADTLTSLGEVRHAAGDPEAAGLSWRQALSILDGLEHRDAGRVRDKLAGLAASPRVELASRG